MTNSLAKRLTFQIMAVVVVMMAIITGIVYFTVREYMLEEAQTRYEGLLLRDQEEVRRRIADVQVAAWNNIYNFDNDADNPDKISAHVERIVGSNPSIIRCRQLYVKGYFPNKGRCFGLFASKDAEKQIYKDTIDSDYNIYIDKEWFKTGISRDTALWSEVYYEYNFHPTLPTRQQLVTYAIPVYGKKGYPIAMFCCDLSLEYLRNKLIDNIVEVNERFEKGRIHHSYCFVIERKGTYIMHPDERRMQNANFLDDVKQNTEATVNITVDSIMKEDQGMAMVEIDGMPSWLYYRAIKHPDWIVAIVVPKDVIFYNGRMLNTIILLVMLIGLVVIYFMCRRKISDTTTPVTAAKAALDRELKIAHDIQMAMLPTMPPNLGSDRNLNNGMSATVGSISQSSNLGDLGIDIYASESPAREVGGDLYDFFLRDNRLYFCIGDVSGKGMAAALMMAVIRAMFRSETRRAESAAAIIDTMNHNLSEEYTAGYFVTMFVGILDLTTGHLDYCNAGHEAPLLSNQPLPIKPNLPVGALPDWNYEGQQAQMKSGDMLFLYTDGLSEAKNNAGQQFGRQHVIQFASQHTSDTAQQLILLMGEEVRLHAAGADQSDDITLLAIKWNQTKLILHSSMEEIGRLKPFVEAVSKQAGMNSKESKRLRLAVEEAVVNVINYGNATTITLQSAMRDEQLILVIEDDGLPFDPTADSTTDLSVPPDQRPLGGMGIILLHKMTDGLNYQRIDGHNILKLIKNV